MMSARGKRQRENGEGGSTRSRSPRRVATVFDAVAGRVGYESFLKEGEYDNENEVKPIGQAVRPDEVLFRRQGAPPRYYEKDEYFANEGLSRDQTLPDCDLLKHIHAYASDFYNSATATCGKRDWRSLDETALLALGILLEETAIQSLGTTGDLALLESEWPETHTSRSSFWDGHRWTRTVLEQRSMRSKTTRQQRSLNT